MVWSLNSPSKINSPAVPHPKPVPTYITKGTGHPTSVSVSDQHEPSSEEGGGYTFMKQSSSLQSLPTRPACPGTAALRKSLTPSCTALSPHAGRTWEVLKLCWDLTTYPQGLSTLDCGLKWKKPCEHVVSRSVSSALFLRFFFFLNLLAMGYQHHEDPLCNFSKQQDLDAPQLNPRAWL